MKAAAILVLVGLIAASSALPRRLKLWPVRIVGGEEVSPNELPYQVSLQYFGSHICGGSIYKSNYVVTAAHCCDAGSASSFTIVAGEHNLAKNDGTEQNVDVSNVIMHPEYNDFDISNDICLLKLDGDIDLMATGAKAIALAETGQETTGDAVVSGWGTLTAGGSLPDILRKVTVPVVTDEECRAAYGQADIFDSMICAGLEEGGKDSCQGDSGGPMVSMANGAEYLSGIVSWGYGCAEPGYPGVYTEVSYFTEWVEATAV